MIKVLRKKTWKKIREKLTYLDKWWFSLDEEKIAVKNAWNLQMLNHWTCQNVEMFPIFIGENAHLHMRNDSGLSNYFILLVIETSPHLWMFSFGTY